LKKKKQKPPLTREQIYALKAWTVKIRGKQFFAAPTYDPTQEHGPYKSLQSCTMAIQRKLQEEFVRRHQRTETFHAR
jgi:hypothetical protein